MLNKFLKWLSKDFNSLFLLFTLLFILDFTFVIDTDNRFEKLESYHNKNICSECGQTITI